MAAGTVLAFLFVAADSIRNGYNMFSSDAFFFVLECVFGVLIFMALLLPIELKFGPEKRRIAMVAIFAVIVAVIFVLKEMLGDIDVMPLLVKLEQLTTSMIFGVSFLVCAVFFIVSYLISCKIMEKKEF